MSVEDTPYCSCPDFADHNEPCKHIYAVLLALERGEVRCNVAGTTRYTQPWAAYNAAQISEGALFEKFLRVLCDTVPLPPQTRGGHVCPCQT